MRLRKKRYQKTKLVKKNKKYNMAALFLTFVASIVMLLWK